MSINRTTASKNLPVCAGGTPQQSNENLQTTHQPARPQTDRRPIHPCAHLHLTSARSNVGPVQARPGRGRSGGRARPSCRPASPRPVSVRGTRSGCTSGPAMREVSSACPLLACAPSRDRDDLRRPVGGPPRPLAPSLSSLPAACAPVLARVADPRRPTLAHASPPRRGTTAHPVTVSVTRPAPPQIKSSGLSFPLHDVRSCVASLCRARRWCQGGGRVRMRAPGRECGVGVGAGMQCDAELEGVILPFLKNQEHWRLGQVYHFMSLHTYPNHLSSGSMDMTLQLKLLSK